MKKSLITVALALLSALAFPSVSAAGEKGSVPQKRYQVNVGWSGYPTSDALWNSGDGSFWDRIWGNQPSLESLYGDWHGNVYTTGNFTASFVWHVRRWFAIEASAGFSTNWTDVYSERYDGGRTKVWGTGHAGVMARFTWVNRRCFRGYSSVGFQAALGTDYGRRVHGFILPQADFIGMEFGSSVFGILEFGAGGEYLGAKVGVGYRF